MPSSRSILVVDDEEIIRITVASELKKEGYDVGVAVNGEEAITKLESQPYDIVITDVMMDGMDGIELLREVKKSTPEIMVIVLTSFGSVSSAVDAMRLGAYDYLLKPCSPGELTLRVANCFKQQELRRKVSLYENILPICSGCKKIKDVSGAESGEDLWIDIESYIHKNSGINFTHGFCPACMEYQMSRLDEMQESKSKGAS